MCLRPTRSINYTSQIAVLFVGIYAAINLFIISRCGEKSAESMSNEIIDLFHAKILIFWNPILTQITLHVSLLDSCSFYLLNLATAS
jgi:hypothetical protein